MAQPSPIQSWNRMFPCVVSAAKSGADSLMRSDMANSLLKALVEGRNPEHHPRWARFIMSRFSDFPRYVSYRGSSWLKEQRLNVGLRRAQSLLALTNNRRTLGNLSHAESSGARRRVEQIKLCTRWPAAA